MILTFLFLIFSLNIRGYVHPEHWFMYSEYLTSFSKPGAIFDSNSNAANIITIVHVLVVFYFNLKYKKIAIRTSFKEDYADTVSFENSLIVKRFLFESITTFVDFFYIGYIRLDIFGLESELASMFAVDEIRRLVTELVIPYLLLKQKK